MSSHERECGSEGRRARATVREMLNGDMPTSMSEGRAVQHIDGCRRCQHRIDQALIKNPTTTYIVGGYEKNLQKVRQIVRLDDRWIRFFRISNPH